MSSIKPFFAMLAGLDGVGKGTSEAAILEELKKKGLRVFDAVAFTQETRKKPSFNTEVKDKSCFVNLDSFDVAYLGEPSYAGIGEDIRFEMIARENKGLYTARETLDGYALERLVHYKRCVIPLREAGKIIVQSRGIPDNLCYQSLQAKQEGNPISDEEILSRPGNQLALQYPPDLLIIPTIDDATKLQDRLSARTGKQDNVSFESLEFQLPLKPYFERQSLRDIFTSRGTKVVHTNASISKEETGRQAVEAVQYLLE